MRLGKETHDGLESPHEQPSAVSSSGAESTTPSATPAPGRRHRLMLLYWAYWGMLGVLTAYAAVRGSVPMLRTSLVLCAVFLAQLGIGQLVSPETIAHALIMFVVDTAACVAITLRPAGKWQSLIGLSFILQLGTHVGRIIPAHPDMNGYFDRLTVLAFMQLFLLGGWLIYVAIGSPSWKFIRNPPPSSAGGESVA